MNPKSLFKPGRVICHVPVGLDPVGRFNNLLQGDNECKHVELMLPNGKIASTGAKLGLWYGERELSSLKGKSFYLLETVDPLTDAQLATVQLAHEDMMSSGPWSRIYGLWKFPWIWSLALMNGNVEKTGFTPKGTRPVAPICSQAVAYPFWLAGAPIGKSQGKQDWTAVLPETILKEAKDTSYDLEQGWLKRREKPCYKFKLVQSLPYTL